ncbi:probable ABC1 transport protein [Cephalotrichum gorgonifer]|uniref:Probable ABC1 transport protein n=1 Tax=Cephalotrichum gorgonifer TaxID=2041049 RepID=A0AAE8N5D7_9PEZI|nr:probable ABC1 transport protein [Cephalotrichum gorgonifer]
MLADTKPEAGAARSPAATVSRTASTTTVAEKPSKKPEDPSATTSDEVFADEEVHDLARRLTAQSHAALGTLFPLPKEGPLDPNSPKFDARQWARAFYDLRASTSGGTGPRTAGFAFRDLDAYGFGTATDFQKSVGNIWLQGVTLVKKLFREKNTQRLDILHGLEGVVHSGEMLAVLGPPGSGCSTFLKTVAGDTHGFHVADGATINYQGIHPNQMRTAFRGEAIYTAEVDHHFPALTVADTLYLAARARSPKTLPEGVSHREYAEHLRDVTMAMFGISHTKNTRVGDDFIRGVSGGERKRVTIAEAALSYSPLQCWDNSTRGLDSANALEFCRTLRTQADVMGCTSAVSIYQASQAAYDIFDKVIVLYEGRQIFFGKTDEAKAYFEELGFVCPVQQTTADFLTSMTSSQERIVQPGWEGKAPRSPDEFAQAWKASRHRALLMEEIDDYLERHPFDGEHYDRFLESRRADQSRPQREKSPFTLTYAEQVRLTLWRSWVLLKADPSIPIAMLVTGTIQSFFAGSVFYNLPDDTTGLLSRSTLLFYAILMNAFTAVLEILTLYAKRKTVEKHARYAFYHPSAESLSAMIMDIPYKIVNAIVLNVIVYFLGNLRREPGPFFFFFLINFSITMCMSMLFRFIGSISRTIDEALAPASIFVLGMILYTGFAIPPPYMEDWIGWFRWINPVYYGLESLMLNEFVGRKFDCATFVPSGPGYEGVSPLERICPVTGAVPGLDYVLGEDHLKSSYGFDNAHRWRNFGVLIALGLFLMVLHLFATDNILSERSRGEVLLFTRNAMRRRAKKGAVDVESGTSGGPHQQQQNSGDDSGVVSDMERQESIFHWKDVSYDIQIKGEHRRILDRVDGWVKPGTLTALMGVSGAGKTTLLDALASRITMGVITGEMLVNGEMRDESFQRKTGYVQQQDIHLHTSTVREALAFSALLRQPARYSRAEKLAYVDTVIGLLNMEEYSDAVIGVPGEGLNVEQRKRLTIGVELAARPQLLLFLDEPTSGLDSQTSWSICNLMEKLTRSGQAILCTIHQPSAMLFQRFDRLLLLASGGRTVYFGEIGKNSQTMVDYFVRNGGPECPAGANPAEYMLEVIGAAPGAHTDIDWPEVWRGSKEYRGVQDELARLKSGKSAAAVVERRSADEDPSAYRQFAAPYVIQLAEVTKRVFQQYWRTPRYIFSKGLLTFGSGLFVGLSFINVENTQRGLQNQMFGIFIFLSLFGQIVNQIMPLFVTQRSLYEARERPSKAYSWQAFLLANVLVEMAWSSIVSVFSFVCWYFPIGLYRNAYPTDTVDSRGITMMLHIWVFYVYSSTFANMVIAGAPNPDIAAGTTNLLLILMFLLCGIVAGPDDFPRFWIWMYRINPFTYVAESFLGTSLAHAPVHCADNEFLFFRAPEGLSCKEYMAPYISVLGGSLVGGDGSDCQYCTMTDTDSFLESIHVSYDNRWRDFGLMWVFCAFNIAAAVGLYWLIRVPKKSKLEKAKEE